MSVRQRLAHTSHTRTYARTRVQAMQTIADWREKVGYYNFFDEMHPLARDFHRCLCVCVCVVFCIYNDIYLYLYT